MLDRIVTEQAAMIAYLNDYKLLMVLTLAMIPLIFIIGTSRRTNGGKPAEAVID